LNADADVFANHCRNPIFIYGTGMSTSDKFRLEVKITYEYIPTVGKKPFALPSGA